jgi:branched-chain amino acid transport system substrate-binding protein
MKTRTAALLALGLALFLSTATAILKPVVKIGAILPLTGPFASIGETMRDGIQLAMEDPLVQNGRFEYQLVIEDVPMETTKGVLAFQKLASVDNVRAVITLNSALGVALKPLANAKKILLFSWSGEPLAADGVAAFTQTMTPDDAAKMFLRLAKQKSARKVYTLVMQHPWCKANLAEIKKQAPAQSVEIISAEFNPGIRDFRMMLAKALETQPDLILLLTFSPEIDLIITQADQMGALSKLTTIESYDYLPSLQVVEGCSYVGQVGTQSFAAAYKKRFGQDYRAGAPNAYDMLLLTVSAIERCPEKNVPPLASIAQNLRSLSGFSGAMGVLTLLPGGIFSSPSVIKQVRNGRAVVAP